MPAVVARSAGLLLIPLLLASLAMATQGPADRAVFEYLHGSGFSGEFVGTCQVAGFRFDTHTSDSFTVSADQAELVVYHTWRNSTIFHVDNQYGHELFVEYEQVAVHTPFEDGPLRFEWDDGGHLFLTQGHLDGLGDLSTSIIGTGWHTTHAKNGLSAGPGSYIEDNGESLGEKVSRIKGPARWLETDQDAFEILGDGFFRFDGLRLKAGSFGLDMPPYRQHERIHETPVSYLSSILHTDAVLMVQGLNVTIPAEKGTLACGDTHWSGHGAATYRVASGEVTHGNTTHDFNDLEFTLNGAFTAKEVVDHHQNPWGAQAVVYAETSGSFASGVDYELLSTSGDPGWPVTAQLGLLALLAGIAFLLWKLLPVPLFTRLTRTKALDHPVRAYLFEQAQKNPGSTFAEAIRATGHSYSTIQHHARQLVTVELLTLICFGRDVHLFPAGTPRARARRVVSLRSHPIRFLIEQLGDEPRPMRQVRARMQDHFGKGASWATRVVTQAEASGLVERVKTEQGVMLCGRE